MKSGKLKYNFLLMLGALIWGSAFVAQSVGMDYIGPFTFNAVRSFLGSLVLLPVIWFMNRGKHTGGLKTGQSVENEEMHSELVQKGSKQQERKTLLKAGICCGILLTISTSLQQIGLVYTSAGKAGFITALYILIVPILGLFVGKRVGVKTWLGVALAVVGMYLLCITSGFSIAYGDFLVLLCAVAFSFHILTVDYFSPKVDGVKLSCLQFFVCGILSIFPMLTEHPQISQILAAWMPIAYAGILSSGVAYTLQIITQKHLNPTVASLLMSLESVFAVLTGWLILHERLSARELFGCVLMFAAIILAQLPQKGIPKDFEKNFTETENVGENHAE